MKLLRATLVSALLVLANLGPGPAAAQDLLEDLPVMADLAAIMERGTLAVAQIDGSLPPVFQVGENGELSGFEIALAEAMAKDLGVTLDIRRTAESYDAVVAQVAAGEADLGISFISYTARRAKHVLFSRPYATQNETVLINRVRGLKFREQCPGEGELARAGLGADMLGVQANSTFAAELRNRLPDLKVRAFDESEQLLRAVRDGEIALSLQGELSARWFLSTNPAARIRLRYCTLEGLRDRIAIAVPPGRFELLAWVNAFLDEHQVDFTVSDLIRHEGPWRFDK